MHRIGFSLNWVFSLEEGGVKHNPRRVSLPHDWSIELPRDANSRMSDKGGYFIGGNGEYKKSLYVHEQWRGMTIMLEVEGAYMNAEVYVGDNLAGIQHYGYTSFVVDMTPYLKTGEDNEITSFLVLFVFFIQN